RVHGPARGAPTLRRSGRAHAFAHLGGARVSAARTLDHALALLQFGDSMFPVGAFSFSNGLESAIEEGVVHDRSSLAGFVGTAVRQAAGCDAIGVLEGHRGARTEDRERVRRADAAVFTRKLNEEMRTMTV